MKNFEIIIKDGKDAISCKLPKKVIERLEVMYPAPIDNELIMKVVIKSLDNFVFVRRKKSIWERLAER